MSETKRRILHATLSLGPLEPVLRRFSLLVSLGLWPRVLGQRHTPRRGPLVVVAPHYCGFDLALLAAAIRRPLQILLVAGNLDTPLLGSVLRARGVFPLRHATFGFEPSNAQTLADAAATVRRGAALAIFPEGFRRAGHGGTTRIAAESGARVLPALIYHATTPRAVPRALVIVRRPLPPPARNARARRTFGARLTRRLRAAGAFRAEGATREILEVALDDARLWRDPRRVMRRAARIARVRGRECRRLAARARRVLRGCAALGCAPDDLRRPAGLLHVLAYLLLLPATGAGLLLGSVPLLFLRIRMRRLLPATRRSARLHAGAACAVPWALALGALGGALLGPIGLALPAVALLGLSCSGLTRRLHRQLCRAPRVRLHRHRLRPALGEFDRACAALTTSRAPRRRRAARFAARL